MEAGEFEAKAVSWDFGFTSNSNEQVAVELQIVSGELKGQSITWYSNFSDDIRGDKTGTEWTLLDLKKLGWNGADLPALPGMGSTVVRIKVEEDTYNGKKQFKVRRIFAGGGLALKNKMSDEQKKALAARVMKKKEVRRDAEGYELDDDGKRIPF